MKELKLLSSRRRYVQMPWLTKAEFFLNMPYRRILTNRPTKAYIHVLNPGGINLPLPARPDE